MKANFWKQTGKDRRKQNIKKKLNNIELVKITKKLQNARQKGN